MVPSLLMTSPGDPIHRLEGDWTGNVRVAVAAAGAITDFHAVAVDHGARARGGVFVCGWQQLVFDVNIYHISILFFHNWHIFLGITVWLSLTADSVPPASELDTLGSTSVDIRGDGSTHAVLALLTVTAVIHAVLNRKPQSEQHPYYAVQ
jgi:hypothetical protein